MPGTSSGRMMIEAHGRKISVPKGTDPENVVGVSWSDDGPVENIVVLKKLNAAEYMEAEARSIKAVYGPEGQLVDMRSEHEWARDVLRELLVEVDEADPTLVDTRKFVPLAIWSCKYSRGVGLQPRPSPVL